MTGGHLHWLWWAGGAAVTLFGVALLLWALFADRARGRRRCPKCWYDLSGTVGMRCSECGYEARREKKLFKTRRRWRWAGVAVLMLLTAAAGISVLAHERGWIGVMPNTVLILSVNHVKSDHLALDELEARLRRGAVSGSDSTGTLWHWQWRMLVKRVAIRDLRIVSRAAKGRTGVTAARSVSPFFGRTPDIEPALDEYREALNSSNPRLVQHSAELLCQYARSLNCDDFDLLIRLAPQHMNSLGPGSLDQRIFNVLQSRPECVEHAVPALIAVYSETRSTQSDSFRHRIMLIDLFLTFGAIKPRSEEIRSILLKEIERPEDAFLRRLALIALALTYPDEAAAILERDCNRDNYTEARDVLSRLARFDREDTRQFVQRIEAGADDELRSLLHRYGLR